MSTSVRTVSPTFRDVLPGELAGTLRSSLGLPRYAKVPGELAVVIHRRMPSIVRQLDAEAWMAWALSGLFVCSGEGPSLSRARLEAKRVLMSLAMLRSRGNTTAAANALGTSRKTLRDNLRAFGLYPWSGTPHHVLPRNVVLSGSGSEHSSPPHRASSELDAAPVVVEDGTEGTVIFTIEDTDGEYGLAVLVRDERTDRLFRGLWVRSDTARAYAREHGHRFVTKV